MIIAQADPLSLVQLLASGGAMVILATAVVGAIVEWWVPGARYRKMEAAYEARLAKLGEDRDEWKSLSLELMQTAHEAVDLAGRK